MTNTQLLEQGLPRIDPAVQFADRVTALVQQAGRAAAELWMELLQWG